MSAQPKTACSLRPPTNYDRLVHEGKLLTLHKYDKIILCFSGGKDSLALLLQMLEWAVNEMGYPLENIELWHQHIDGDPDDDGSQFMDWACTAAYVKAVANALGVTLRNQWKDGGFEGELLRDTVSTSGVYYEDEFGAVVYAKPQKPAMQCKHTKTEHSDCDPHSFPEPIWDTDERRWIVAKPEYAACPVCEKRRSGIGSRMRWPAKGSDLQTRWCSGYLKIDVAKRAINCDSRFNGKNILVLTGERAEESTARSKYDEVVPHGSNTKSRRVDQWRSVLYWDETDVWGIIERWRIIPHPAYRLGWDRVSCALCIFGGPDQLAAAKHVIPCQFRTISGTETKLGHTINHKRQKGKVVELPIIELASQGNNFAANAPQWLIDLATEKEYPSHLVFVPDGEKWELPAGAYKKTGCGPT